MSLYRITVEKLSRENNKDYETWVDIYRQRIDADNSIVKIVASAVLKYEPEQLEELRSVTATGQEPPVTIVC